MPDKIHEGKWSDAKSATRKQHPDWEEKNPRFWKAVSSSYKSMGGEFSDSMKKSLASIEAAERITPSFIEDPRLWVQAINKSVGSLRWDVEHLGIILKSYAALGGKLMKSGMSDCTNVEAESAKNIASQFSKAATGSFHGVHKYAQRVEKPGGGYKYIYNADDGSRAGAPRAEGSGTGYQKVPKKPGQLGVVPEGQARSKNSMAEIVEGLNKKTKSAQRASLQNVSDDALTSLASHAKEGSGLHKVISEEKAGRKVKDSKTKAEAVEKPKGDTKKSQNDDFDKFSDTHYGDVKATLQKSHPDWDDNTLLERTGAQLRQLYKMRG